LGGELEREELGELLFEVGLGAKGWGGGNGFGGWRYGIPNPFGRSFALRLQSLGEFPSLVLIHL